MPLWRFGTNFNGAAFCHPHQLVGFLFQISSNSRSKGQIHFCCSHMLKTWVAYDRPRKPNVLTLRQHKICLNYDQSKFRDLWTLTSYSRSRSRSQIPFWHLRTSTVEDYQHTKNPLPNTHELISSNTYSTQARAHKWQYPIKRKRYSLAYRLISATY